MRYSEFKEYVYNNFKNYLPEEYSDAEVHMEVIQKVNQYLDALIVKKPTNAGAVPTMYIRDMYSRYEEVGNVQDVLKEAAEFFIKWAREGTKVFGELDFSQAGSNIVFTLVNREKNQKLLENVPHRDMMDLSIIYRWIVSMPGNGMQSTIITNDLAKEMGFDEEQLYKMASDNSPKILKKNICAIAPEFFAVTNEVMFNGASVILYEGVLNELAEKVGDDLIIIPSSVHETIVLPSSSKSNIRTLRRVVEQANKTVVKDSEVLSDQIYKFIRSGEELVICAD